MKILPKLLLCVIAAALHLGVAAGQTGVTQESRRAPGAEAVTLSSAVDAAWQRAVLAAEAQGRRVRADAEQVASSAPWSSPPSLELSHRSGRWAGDIGVRESEVGLAVPLWLPGQRAARQSAAESHLLVAETEMAATRLRVAGQVREAAWRIAAQRAEIDLAEVELRSLRRLAADVERRVSAGELAKADFLAARAELLAAENSLTAARARLQAVLAQWTSLTGLTVTPDPREPAPARAESVDETQHPELQLARHEVELARKRLEVAQRSDRDPPEVVARYRRDAPGGGAASVDSLGLALRIPFGTDDRNQPLLAEASSALAVAQAAANRLRDQLAADIAAARASVIAADRQVEVERGRVSLLQERSRLVDAAFRAGEISLPETLRAFGAAAQASAALARQEAALGLARARLNQFLGVMP